MNNRGKQIFLILIPLLFLLFELFFKANYRFYYLSVFDPSYAYLFNGLNLAQFKFELGHTDHPGTPLQVLIAIIIRIVYAFRNTDHDLVDDVITHAEFYLGVVSYVLLFLNTLVLVLLGQVVDKRLHNLRVALFMQASLFFSPGILQMSSIVMTEPLYIFAEMGIIVWLFIFLKRDREIPIPAFYIWLPGVIIGFGMATKIILIPLIIIPLVLFSRWKHRLIFSGITLVSFLIFVLPAVHKASRFFSWISKLALNSGSYGVTGRGFDLLEMINNIRGILKDDIFYTITLAILILMNFCWLIPKIRLSLKNFFFPRITFALLLFNLLLCGLVSRHYSYHYMIVGYVFLAFDWWVIATAFLEYFRFQMPQKLINYMVIFLTVFIIIRAFVFTGVFQESYNPRMNTLDFVQENVGDTPRIIFESNKSEAAFKEMGLYFGYAYAGKIKSSYSRKLKAIFPDTYFYAAASNQIFDWSSTVFPQNIIFSYDTVYLYQRLKNRGELEVVLKKFREIKAVDSMAVSVKQVFYNNETDEVLYKLIFNLDNEERRNINLIKREFFCDCERINGNNEFLSSIDTCFFKKADLRSDELSFSGSYASKQTKDKPYGLDFFLDVLPGELYKISAWRNSPDGSGIIVATSKDKSFYVAGGSVQQVKFPWERIEINLEIPENFTENQIHIYLWNQVKENNVFFDDFRIEQHNK